MEIIFWLSVGLLFHTYFFYPLSLPILRIFFSNRRRTGDPGKYKVSIIIAAYNEEKIIEEKIKNCFDIDFPRDKLEILVGSDASTDATHAIVNKYKDEVRLVICTPRGGKAAVLNHLVPKATGDILVFCDANTMLLKNALQKLLMHFEDDSVGCVCGRLILHDAGTSALGIGESIYWNLESEIKKMEGQLGVVIGANGGIYAIRKELFKQIPVTKTTMDDFFVTTQVLETGNAAIYEPQAIGSEETSAQTFGEFHRKVRISQANFNQIKNYLPLLNPRFGLVAYSFFSHKLLRWTAPLFMLACFFSNAILLGAGSIYLLAFAMQGLLYGLAGIGAMQNGKGKKSKIFLIPFYFVSMNVALLMGMLKAWTGTSGGMWNRIERNATQSNAPATPPA